MGERARKKAAISVWQGVKNQKDLCSNFLFLLHDVAGQEVWFDCEGSKGTVLTGVVGCKGASKGFIPFWLGT